MYAIPKILYKYKAISDDDREDGDSSKPYTKNIFTKGELYFSRFDELNDPNEAIFDYSTHIPIFLSENELNDNLYHDFLNTSKDIEGRIQLMVNGRTAALHVMQRINLHIPYGVLCFTEDRVNSLMFDYYAGGHKGICIGFDWKKLGLIVRDTNKYQHPRKIKYRSIPPIINPTNAYNFDDVFFTKSKKYKHEKELRLLHTPGVYSSPNNVLSAIKEIIFGCAVSPSDRELIKDWTNSLNDLSFYETYLRPKSYKLGIRSL